MAKGSISSFRTTFHPSFSQIPSFFALLLVNVDISLTEHLDREITNHIFSSLLKILISSVLLSTFRIARLFINFWPAILGKLIASVNNLCCCFSSSDDSKSAVKVQHQAVLWIFGPITPRKCRDTISSWFAIGKDPLFEQNHSTKVKSIFSKKSRKKQNISANFSGMTPSSENTKH